MKILIQRGWTWLAAAAALAVTGLPAHADSFAVGDKPANADRIDFTVDLQPWDAFSATNKVGASREFNRGEVIRLVIHGAPRKGFHTYPLTQQYKDQAPFISHLTVEKSDDFRPLWPIVETPPPESVFEKGEGLGFFLEYRAPFTWIQEVYIQRNAKPGLARLHFAIDLQVCDEHTCQPGTHTFEVPFTIIDGPPAEPRAELDEQLKVVKAPPVTLIEAPAAPAAAAAESFVVGKSPPTAKYIDFKLDLQPWDAFSNPNKVGAPREFRRGEVIRLVIQGTPHEGFHTYPLTRQFKGQQGNASTIRYAADDAFMALWPPTETPAPEPVMEEGVGAYLEHRQPVTWTQDFYIKPDAKVGAERLHFTMSVQVCNKDFCHLGEHEFEVPFTIIDSPVVPPPADLEQRLQFTQPPAETLNFQGKDYSVVSLLPAVKSAFVPPIVGDGPKAPPPPAAPPLSESFAVNNPPTAKYIDFQVDLAPPPSDLTWLGDLNEALKQGESQNKLVFLDFTAQTCTNCKYNEREIFTIPDVKNQLDRYVLVHLYTDKVPPEYDSTTTGPQNQKLQADTFGSDQLPLYAILKPKRNGGHEVVGEPYKEGKINDVSGFFRFLQGAADANKVGMSREFRRGEVVRLVIHGKPHEGFHTYPLTKQFSGQKGNATTIRYAKDDALKALWPPTETPAPEPVMEERVGAFLEHRQPFTWTQDFYIKPDTKVGTERLHFTMSVQVCNDGGCHNGDFEFEVPFKIIDSPVVPPPADLDQRLLFTPPPPKSLTFKGEEYSVVSLLPAVKPAEAPPPGSPLGAERNDDHPKEVQQAKTESSGPVTILRKGGAGKPCARRDQPVGPAWLHVAGGPLGALSLLTPCVFPMIPITVSFFLKQSEKSSKRALPETPARKAHSPVLLAAIYSSTIALVLTVAGVLLLRLVQPVSQHWATNLVLGGLFIFFALSLFGMYDIMLPSWLGRLAAGGEGRGGLLGVVFMALTFTIISFACVAPFYGGFIALTASAATASDWIKLSLGALAFSVTFALPFFVLALFPSLLKALPKSGSWMNTVKVVMGFLELAAAFKFLRAAEINGLVKSQFLTYDLVLGIYVALAVACGLYLLGVYRLPHDHGTAESLTVPRLLFSIAFLGLALYLLPGLFRTTVEDKQTLRRKELQQRPDGAVFAWLDAFLLPEKSELTWVGDLRMGLQKARAENKLVFLDFTAETCTNCKFNENSIFIKPEVKNQLDKYVLVHLYTDKVPPEYDSTTTGPQNQKLQADTFGSDQLPLYAILQPIDADGSTAYLIAEPYPEGKINDVNGFTKYLKSALNHGTDAVAEAKSQ